jgi:hypothetical protein
VSTPFRSYLTGADGNAEGEAMFDFAHNRERELKLLIDAVLLFDQRFDVLAVLVDPLPGLQKFASPIPH